MTAERVSLIRSRLEAAFSPEELEVADESRLHVGHPGARDGKGHFKVYIVSKRFVGTNPLERHRMVYDALDDMMKSEIHALSLTALAPSAPRKT